MKWAQESCGLSKPGRLPCFPLIECLTLSKHGYTMLSLNEIVAAPGKVNEFTVRSLNATVPYGFRVH